MSDGTTAAVAPTTGATDAPAQNTPTLPNGAVGYDDYEKPAILRDASGYDDEPTAYQEEEQPKPKAEPKPAVKAKEPQEKAPPETEEQKAEKEAKAEEKRLLKKFKSAGREVQYTEEQAIRRIQQLEGLEQQKQQIAADRAKLEALLARFSSTEGSIEAIAEMHPDADEVITRRAIEKYQREQQLAALDPQTRELYQAFQQQQAELAKYKTQEQQFQEEQQRQLEQQQTEALRNDVSDVALKALQKAALPEVLVDDALDEVSRMIAADLDNQQMPDPEAYADEVKAKNEARVQTAIIKSPVENLINVLGLEALEKCARAYMLTRSTSEPRAKTPQPPAPRKFEEKTSERSFYPDQREHMRKLGLL